MELLYQANTSIYLYQNGNVRGWTLANDTTINGIIYKGNEDIILY